MTTPTPRTAIVIGAGVAGLATAALLAHEGTEVTVLDRIDTVGGRAGDLTIEDHPGFRWDTGPSWYLMPDAFDHFFRLLGTTAEEQLDLVDLTPAYRVFPEGEQPLDVPSGVDAAAELFESIEPGAGQALRDYLDSAGDSYRIALERFLYTTFSAVGPLLHRDVRVRLGRLAKLLTQPLESFVNEQFRDTRLRQILTYPAVFLSSRPEKTPSLYHLMSHTDLVQGVRYPVGGFTAVVEALHRLAVEQGVRIRLNTEVTAVITAPDGRKARATGVRVRGADGRIGEIAADIVVSGADLHHTENHLLPAKLRTYPERYWASRDPGIGTVLVMLGVRGKLPQLTHHNLLFSRDWSEDFAVVFDGPHPDRPLGASRSIYVSMPSATEPGVAPEGHENLFLLVPVPAAEGVGHGDTFRGTGASAVEAVADAAIAQLAEWADIPDLAERIVIRHTVGPADFAERYHAWRGGSIGPGHSLRQSAFLRGRNASAKVDGLYYAGATTVPGVGVPMCLISAENVIKRLHGDTSPGPLPEAGGAHA
ncbi:phytoene desaturase family protein [Corynebacterium halotolerans]|uniref:Phytoene dehydrogenase n=1 Tax=Corynebacterium halotolerans YIM 70093 = DSM 44683 TaxID=1121362 RepID=M1NW42_9CORY|nr:phytoene desaturase family protein [Corynebacterium halotolerans]AGF71715.1 phytoene dehydrogenase [Corynebacterium halotolerans YIM 70093 = DSM 44683]